MEDLKKNLATFEETIRDIRFKAQGSRSKNVKEVAGIKKQIARILTEMNKNNSKSNTKKVNK